MTAGLGTNTRAVNDRAGLGGRAADHQSLPDGLATLAGEAVKSGFGSASGSSRRDGESEKRIVSSGIRMGSSPSRNASWREVQRKPRYVRDIQLKKSPNDEVTKIRSGR